MQAGRSDLHLHPPRRLRAARARLVVALHLALGTRRSDRQLDPDRSRIPRLRGGDVHADRHAAPRKRHRACGGLQFVRPRGERREPGGARRDAGHPRVRRLAPVERAERLLERNQRDRRGGRELVDRRRRLQGRRPRLLRHGPLGPGRRESEDDLEGPPARRAHRIRRERRLPLAQPGQPADGRARAFGVVGRPGDRAPPARLEERASRRRERRLRRGHRQDAVRADVLAHRHRSDQRERRRHPQLHRRHRPRRRAGDHHREQRLQIGEGRQLADRLHLPPSLRPGRANREQAAELPVRKHDKHPQIVVATRGFLRIHDWTGGILLNPVPLPASTNPDCASETNMGGAPTIADFDGDGLPEVGIAAQGGYVVWKPGKGFIWQSQTFDCSSATGSSLLDFEGKGNASVVYSDQCYFRVYDGKTGATLVQEKNASCTAYETPIVADIDGSGRAKVLVPNSNVCAYKCDWPGGTVQIDTSPYVGLKALRSPSDKWVNTRSVWNQHAYHVTNVNVDGTLPFPEQNSWDPGQSNSYRQNVQGQGVFSSPDLSVCEVDPDLTNCMTGGAAVGATVYNGGAIPARPGVQVDFYADLPGGSVLIGSGATKTTLQPGASEKVTVPWSAPPQNASAPVRAVVDPNQKVGDCHFENNTASSAAVKCSPIG